MALSNLYLLRYNNYYNRIYKKLSSASAYSAYLIGDVIQNINFIPGDYITTQQIINWDYDEMPDYCVVTDTDSAILHRWFVIDCRRTRGGQYQITLKRDVLADYYDYYHDAPCYVEKSIPKSITDPAIYNSENMTFNQIKQSEQLLWDETGCGWVVGYIPRDSFTENTTISVETPATTGSADVIVDNLSDWKYYQYINNSNARIMAAYVYVRITLSRIIDGEIYESNWLCNLDASANTDIENSSDPVSGSTRQVWTENLASVSASFCISFTSTYRNLDIAGSYAPEQYITAYDVLSYVDGQELLALNGANIYVRNEDKFYRISATSSTTSGYTYTDLATDNPITQVLLENTPDSVASATINKSTSSSYSPSFALRNPITTLSLSVEEYEGGEQASVTINTTVGPDRTHLVQSPFDMFCIPYSDTFTVYNNGSAYVSGTSRSAALAIAQQIAAQVGSGNVYDTQLVPYCPMRSLIDSNGRFDIAEASFSDITSSAGTRLSVLVWCDTDNLDFNISVSLPQETSVWNKKIAYMTDFIRLCAPNFSNSFEFNPQMNEGCNSIRVVCYFQPYSPYIKLQPVFNGLYGADFNDGRGLVCNGDFSLAQITSAWADYELQNKNYQNIFNRQIQNLQVSNAIENQSNLWSTIAGTASGLVSGAGAGALTGGLPGAIVGGLVGGVASGIAGAVDYQNTIKLQNETIDYQTDLYNYNLQNIQAVPYGLSKVSAIAPDNKIVPFIEFYSCTDEEKTALRNKMLYNGMTIMMIGTLDDYLTSDEQYFKAQLIRIEDFPDDFHMLNELGKELNMGVFIHA